MRDLNKVMIIGRLGRDPEIHYTPSGHPRTRFSVATSRNWTTHDGDRRYDTEWFTVVAWDRLAEICSQYLSKGQRVFIEGRLQTRHWEDQTGTKHSSTEIIANEMLILSQPSEGGEDRRILNHPANVHPDDTTPDLHPVDEDLGNFEDSTPPPELSESDDEFSF